MKDNTSGTSTDQQPTNGAQPSAETQIVLLPRAKAGESLTVAEVELKDTSLGCYNEIMTHLGASNTPQKFIKKSVVDAVPVRVIADIVVNLLAKNHKVPTVLAIAAKSDKECKKLVIKARGEHKELLVKNQQVIIAGLVRDGFRITKMTRNNTVDSKGRECVDIQFKTGEAPTESEVASVVGRMSAAQLREQLARLEAASNTTEVVATVQ